MDLPRSPYSELGCVHQIAFNETDSSWHYTIDNTQREASTIVAVIDAETAAAEYGFRAFSTGIAHKWVANYGQMLGQVADLELPQLAGSYEKSTSYEEPTTGERRLVLVLTVPTYVFQDYRAKLTLHAEGFGPQHNLIFAESYSTEGKSEAGKMVGAGAFGQKSAVRVSSLDAFRKAFEMMRRDVIAALESPATEVATELRHPQRNTAREGQ